MSALSFDASRIEDWAAFSGDRNPIHFHRDAARLLGAEDVVVHGMLPLLHAQDACARAAAPPTAPGEWRMWQARLKRPLLRDREVHVRLETTAEGVKFALTDRDTPTKYFHGRFERVLRTAEKPASGVDEPELVHIPSIEIDAAALASRARTFQEIFPELGQSAWICMSAIAFAQFLSDGTPFLRLAVLRQVSGGDPITDLGPPGVVAVQTTHAVTFDVDYFNGRAVGDIPGCTCAFVPAQTFKVEGGFAATISWSVDVGARRIMELSVGLMLKV